MATSQDSLAHSIESITASRPPATDYLTYLTILESHLSPEILPTLNNVLQDVDLTQNIGWDLVHSLINIPGGETCLKTIAKLGNPREVILQVTEALRQLNLDETIEEAEEGVKKDDSEKAEDKPLDGSQRASPKEVDKFCILVSLLATLHPRIKTKFPSRFLSTSLMAILSSYRPSNQATYAVIAFGHALSGQKRPLLPTRKSSLSIHNLTISTPTEKNESAPDPEATAEDPFEEGIQEKLLQSFVTHVLQLYISENPLEWAARLQEHYAPSKIVPNRKSFSEKYREDPALQEREVVVGQIVALARDLGLTGHEFLFIESPSTPAPEPEESDKEDEPSPSSPDDIPLSQIGSLYLVTCFVFSAIIFNTNVTLPPLSIFPDLANLVSKFLGTSGVETTGTEETGVIDAILALGLWLYSTDKFVAGPLEDEDFLQLIQTLSLISANCPDPTLRYHAHLLTSKILHAHPDHRVRLTFVSDTLEHCPYESLRASAVGWLKEEIITAAERKSDNVFSSTAALSAVQPYLFPYEFTLTAEKPTEAWEELKTAFPFHMAVLNFIYFIGKGGYVSVVPAGMLAVVEEIYLTPLRAVRMNLEKELEKDGGLRRDLGEGEAEAALNEIRLLGERLDVCLEGDAQ